LLLASILATCAACGDPVDVGGFNGQSGGAGAAGSAGSETGGTAGSSGSGTGGDSGSSGAAGAPNPVGTGTGKVAIRFQSTTTPFVHGDGLSGQTPLSHLSGVRSLR
jgi:hypothetical protein